MIINKSIAEKEFALDYQETFGGVGATRAALSKILRSFDLVGWSRREESGKLDRRAFSRLAAGESTVFSRRTAAEADTAAVSVLVDCSGSMFWDDRSRIAQIVTIQLAKMLEQTRVKYAIRGFNGSALANGAEEVNFIQIKEWGESIQKAKAKLGHIQHMPDNSTPDYGALYLSVEELSKLPEHRRILFVITDSDFFIAEHIKHIHRIADKVGVTIAAIGIQASVISNVFENAVSVDNLTDLGQSAFKVLLNGLRK
jgi:cobalamin biosynthesis protein CobT